VVQRVFDNWSSHQNWAMEHIEFKHPWVYYLDADEIATPELRDELLATAQAPGDHGAFGIRYKNYFMGRWIRHCGIYGVRNVRFFRPSAIRFERTVNPVPVVQGRIGHLKEHYEHHSFNTGFDQWFAKHNRYSTREAEECLSDLARGGLKLTELFARGHFARRQALKRLSFRLPFRPTLKFIYMYFLRFGFLDGRPGLTYCRLVAIYEYMIVLKMIEKRRRLRGAPL
jgi:hypothetical protein